MGAGLHFNLCLLAFSLSLPAAPLLSIEFNCRTNPIPSAGFVSFLINSNISISAVQTNPATRTIGTNRITLSGGGANPGHGDHSRPEPVNQAAFTESTLLRDGVYSPDSSDQGRLDVRIENLPASSRLKVTVWSFDAAAAPVRASDWFANGLLVRSDYRFTNSVPPISNEQYRFSFLATIPASGDLLIQGRRNPASIGAAGIPHRSVVLNAIRIEPEPLEIVSLEPAGAELRLTFVVWPQPGTYGVDEYVSGQWRALGGVNYGAAAANRVTARFARPASTRFYRVRYNY